MLFVVEHLPSAYINAYYSSSTAAIFITALYYMKYSLM